MDSEHRRCSITHRGSEGHANEPWRAVDEGRQKELKEGPFSKLPFGGEDLVRTADTIIEVCNPMLSAAPSLTDTLRTN